MVVVTIGTAGTARGKDETWGGNGVKVPRLPCSCRFCGVVPDFQTVEKGVDIRSPRGLQRRLERVPAERIIIAIAVAKQRRRPVARQRR